MDIVSILMLRLTCILLAKPKCDGLIDKVNQFTIIASAFLLFFMLNKYIRVSNQYCVRSVKKIFDDVLQKVLLCCLNGK